MFYFYYFFFIGSSILPDKCKRPWTLGHKGSTRQVSMTQVSWKGKNGASQIHVITLFRLFKINNETTRKEREAHKYWWLLLAFLHMCRSTVTCRFLDVYVLACSSLSCTVKVQLGWVVAWVCWPSDYRVEEWENKKAWKYSSHTCLSHTCR